MSKDQIIRAWKDEEYRNSLTPAQRARIPANPAGFFNLSDEEMQTAVGGADQPGNPVVIGAPTHFPVCFMGPGLSAVQQVGVKP